MILNYHGLIGFNNIGRIVMKLNKLIVALGFLFAIPVLAYAIPPTPVAEYSFDNIGVNGLPDLSPSQNNGQIVGAVSAPGRNGLGLRFNGNNYVEIGLTPSLLLAGQVSLEAWVFPTAFSPGWQAVITSTNYAYYLYTNDTNLGSLGGVLTSNYVEARNSQSLALNTWSHIAMTYNGYVVVYYINGIEVARQNTQGNIQAINGALYIGGLSGSEGFIGIIDDVRVYNAALTALDIQQDMQLAVGTPAAPDSAPPSVVITNLPQNTIVTGFYTFTANASDDTAVVSVEFFLDNVSLAVADTTPPFNAFINSSTQSNGTYILTAVATDSVNKTSISSPITIEITNEQVLTPPGAISFSLNEANPSPTDLRYDYGLQTVIPAGFGEGEFTFELWIKPDNSFAFGQTDGGDGQRFNWTNVPANPQPSDGDGWWFKGNFLLDGHSNASDGRGTFSLQMYGGGRVRWHFYDSAAEWGIQGANVDTAPNVVDGNWHQISLVRRWVGTSDAALELWVDGAQVGQVISSARDNMRDYWDTWANFLPGNEGWFWGTEKLTAIGVFYQYEDYKGLIDEVRYWSRAKTAVELTNNYQDAVTGMEQNLVGLYRFSIGDSRMNCNVLINDSSNCITFINMFPDFRVVDNAPIGGVIMPPSTDTQDPVINITSPADNARVVGTISIETNATDNIGVVGVQFRINGANINTEIVSAPYQVSLDTTRLSNGTYTITALARDTSNNQGLSQPVVVNVDNTQTIPGSTTMVDFDNPALNVNPNGLFQGINFGSGQWSVSGPYGTNNTNHIYFSMNVSSRSFTFANGPSVLTSLRLYALGSQSQTITLTDNNGQMVSLTISNSDGVQTIVTNWTNPSSTITLSSTAGWAFGLDDIGYR